MRRYRLLSVCVKYRTNCLQAAHLLYCVNPPHAAFGPLTRDRGGGEGHHDK
jgi:hypothetical protein